MKAIICDNCQRPIEEDTDGMLAYHSTKGVNLRVLGEHYDACTVPCAMVLLGRAEAERIAEEAESDKKSK